MKKNFEKAFTLIELLAVIIILAIVALISTPIILNVVDEARESANKSSVAMYADAIKLAVIDSYFENQSYPAVNNTWIENNVEYGGERISCVESYYTETEGVTLHECTVGNSAFNYVDDMSVSAENTVYCYSKGKVYTDCEDAEYEAYHLAAQSGTSIPSNVVFDNEEGVNKPQLLEGMTPIKWDGITEVETDENDNAWYDYSNKLWANAKTKDGSYWVWVPRYAYMIGVGYHTNTANEISIEFLKNDTITNVNNTVIETTGYEVGVKDTSNNYFLHPAFENEEIKYGFWVGKFEASGSSSNIEIKPGMASLRSMTIGDMFDAAISMKNNTMYGFNVSETETHMMSNYEWGAVAYLSQSLYGKNSEVNINDGGYYTGGGTSDAYITNIEQSTTGNITGIYDMSGGGVEYVAAYIDNANDALLYGNSIITSTSNYKNIYEVGEPDAQVNNYTNNVNIYGDAIYETSDSYKGNSSWYGDCTYTPYTNEPWYSRGGRYTHSGAAGLFNLHFCTGASSGVYSFRPVVSVIK